MLFKILFIDSKKILFNIKYITLRELKIRKDVI